jgi:hypothetical protein
MGLPVEFLAGADRELQEIFNLYEERRNGFGLEFMTLVEAYLVRISTFPEIAPLYFENVRRQVICRFPHGIFYQPYPTRIIVVAILDLRQDEGQILRRLRQ